MQVSSEQVVVGDCSAGGCVVANAFHPIRWSLKNLAINMEEELPPHGMGLIAALPLSPLPPILVILEQNDDVASSSVVAHNHPWMHWGPLCYNFEDEGRAYIG